jgi:ComF family protein
MVNELAACLLDGIFPQYCALCGLRSQRAAPLCLECEQEMPLNDTCCKRCAIPLPPSAGTCHSRVCGQCLQTSPPFDSVIAPWLYGEYLAFLIHQWKYRRDRRMTQLLAKLWLQGARPQESIDAVVPVPLHWRRRWWRGFNQSELLGRELLATSPRLRDCAFLPGVVKRQRATAAQSGMTAPQRAINMEGAFTVQGRCDNLRIAIVDDVLTTGATAAAVARALTAAGAPYVEVWCLARTPAPGR